MHYLHTRAADCTWAGAQLCLLPLQVAVEKKMVPKQRPVQGLCLGTHWSDGGPHWTGSESHLWTMWSWTVGIVSTCTYLLKYARFICCTCITTPYSVYLVHCCCCCWPYIPLYVSLHSGTLFFLIAIQSERLRLSQQLHCRVTLNGCQSLQALLSQQMTTTVTTCLHVAAINKHIRIAEQG